MKTTVSMLSSKKNPFGSIRIICSLFECSGNVKVSFTMTPSPLFSWPIIINPLLLKYAAVVIIASKAVPFS